MNVGILGAIGAVGRQMLECIKEQGIQVDELRLFASHRSAGRIVHFQGKEIHLESVNEDSFVGLDYVLGAVGNDVIRQYLPWIQKSQAVLIDNSSAFRLMDEIPLVVPEINGDDIDKHHGIIANPNCSTIISMLAVAPIEKLSPIVSITATTFQAVSGAGIGGMQELSQQIQQLQQGEAVQPSVFPVQIAYNCIPMIGSLLENGFTSEEMKMQNEGRKILHSPELKVNCTCVRVPVYRSHSISLTIQTKKELSLDQIRESIKSFSGVKLIEDMVPTPLDTSNQDLVYIGRLRKDENQKNTYTLWCCGDQIRKGAATNTVQIMKCLMHSH